MDLQMVAYMCVYTWNTELDKDDYISFCSYDFLLSTELAQLLPIKPHDAPFHCWPILIWKNAHCCSLSLALVLGFEFRSSSYLAGILLTKPIYQDWIFFPFSFWDGRMCPILNSHSPIQTRRSELLIILPSPAVSFSWYLK